MKLKQRIKQFSCLHYWRQCLPLDIQMGKGYLYAYQCIVCDKEIKRWETDSPISGIVTNPRFNKKDPQFNASPPILYVDEKF